MGILIVFLVFCVLLRLFHLRAEWIPAFAGMTVFVAICGLSLVVIPAKAGIHRRTILLTEKLKLVYLIDIAKKVW